MFVALLVIQVAVPLGLLGWLWWWPPASRVGLGVQAGATALLLLAAALTGIWLFPPWWTPALYAGLFAGALLFPRRRHHSPTAWPGSALAWICTAGFLLLGAMAAREVIGGLSARRQPTGDTALLDFPLPPGTYLVVNGGSGLRLNAHLRTLDPTVARFRAWRGNSYGLDLVRVNRLGFRASGVLPGDPARYLTFGTPVLAPCHGRAVAAVDGFPDQPVPTTDLEHRAGNHVILRCGGIHVVLAHFRRGSVVVQAGDSVERGTVIGAVGNSGASDEPHLHIHAQRPGTPEAPMGGEPLPMRIGGRFMVRNQRVTVD